jgi:hypothetical protein
MLWSNNNRMVNAGKLSAWCGRGLRTTWDGVLPPLRELSNSNDSTVWPALVGPTEKPYVV